jgi:hypothetical protein
MAGFRAKAGLGNVGQATLQKLKALGPKLEKKILRAAVDKGTKYLTKQTKANVPVQTGLLKKSIGSKVKTYPNGKIIGIVGPRSGFRQQVVTRGRKGAILRTKKGLKLFMAGGKDTVRNPLKYAHLTELKRKWMARTFASAGPTAVKIVQAAIVDGLLKAARK